MSTLGGTYETGTVDVTNASPTITGTGVSWSDVLEGDEIWVGGVVGIVDSVNVGLDEITLKHNWLGVTLTGETYVIVKRAWSRYDPAYTQGQLRDLISAYGVPRQGSWTPALLGDGSNPTVSYTDTPQGDYLRIGNLVHFHASLLISTISGGSGSLYLELPFAVQAEPADIYPIWSLDLPNADFNGETHFFGVGTFGTAVVYFQSDNDSNPTQYTLQAGDIPAGTYISVSGTYITDDP